MSAHVNICGECNADISEAVANDASACPACGWPVRPDANAVTKPSLRWRRGELWFCFGALFLGTPVLAVMCVRNNEQLALAILLAGTFSGGFTLAKMFAKTTRSFVALGIAFSVCIFIIYAAAAYGLMMAALYHMGC